ncbi:uncharacterized protein METZ01_LOCUS229490, partial [marine metagenome]
MTEDTTDSHEHETGVDRLWDNLKRGLQDGAELAMNKAEELTQVGRARLDVAAAKTRLSRLQAELGAVAFTRLEAGEAVSVDEVGGLCDQIRQAAGDLQVAEEA